MAKKKVTAGGRPAARDIDWTIPLNQPLSDEEREEAAYQIRTKNNKTAAYFDEVARTLEAGESLTEEQKKYAAHACKEAASRFRSADPYPPKKRGGRSGKTFIPDDAALLFASMLSRGVSRNKAVEYLAEWYSVSNQAIKKNLGMTKSPNQAKKQKITASLVDELQIAEEIRRQKAAAGQTGTITVTSEEIAAAKARRT